MENQELFWSWINNRIQKYPHIIYGDHIGYPASSDIVRKIDFMVTDSTAHDCSKVIEKIKKLSNKNCFSFHAFYLQLISFNILLIIVQTPPPPPFFKDGGRVNFNYLPQRGGPWKIRKRGRSIVQEQVFLKGGGRVALSLFIFVKVYYIYI